jgi:hypothetical protein
MKEACEEKDGRIDSQRTYIASGEKESVHS